MRVVQLHAVLKARETERDLQNLYTLEHRLICLYTWRQQGKKREKPKNMTHMHHSCTISGRKPPQEPCASTPSPSPSLMERGLGGLTSIGFLPLGAGLFPRSAFLSFSTLLFLLRFLLVQN